MICVAVTYLIQPGHEEEAIELFATLTEHTHTEPGNLYYLVHRSLTEPRRFFIYEQYSDMAALDTHRASPHFAQYATNGLFNILEKREAEIYAPLPKVRLVSLFRSQPDLLRKFSKTSLTAAGDDSLFDSYPGENGRLPTNASEQAYWPG